MDLNYVTAYGEEGYGETAGAFGIKIQVAAGRQLTREEGRAISGHAEAIKALLLENTIRQNPKDMERAKNERESLLALFPQSFHYVEEIPNGYCSQYCCKHLPWFIVTTVKGRIKIGWRKRVIEIDWSDSAIEKTAQELFHKEYATKENKLIHALGYEKAQKYIDILLNS